VIGEKTSSNKPLRIGSLVHTTNKLDESVSSSDESLSSNTTIFRRNFSIDEKEASFRFPLCVPDFESPRAAAKSDRLSSKNPGLKRVTPQMSREGGFDLSDGVHDASPPAQKTNNPSAVAFNKNYEYILPVVQKSTAQKMQHPDISISMDQDY